MDLGARMVYNWGIILFIMGYIIGLHSLPSEIEGFVGKVDKTSSFIKKNNILFDFFLM